MSWPKNLEKPLYYQNLLDGIRSSLHSVYAKIDAAESIVLAAEFMGDDEKASKLMKTTIRRQKVLNNAKRRLVEIGDYLSELEQAAEWAREIRQPDLGTTREWQQAAARGEFIKAEVEAMAAAGDFSQIVDLYRKAEIQSDSVLAWLLQQHGLMLPTTEANAEGKADLTSEIAKFHPADRDILEAIEKARASLAPGYSEISGLQGPADEQEIRQVFGLTRKPVEPLPP